jgi:hypothetical protein
VIPRPAEKYVGYDTRLAVSLNDGRRLSTTERLSRWGVGNILSAFSAAGGDTLTEYVFNRRLHSPANKFHVALVTSARERGFVTADQHAQYIVAVVEAGYSSHAVYRVARQYNIPVLETIAGDRFFTRRIFVDGISFQDYLAMTTLANGVYSEKFSALLRSRVSDEARSIRVVTIDSAEKAGQINQTKSDALLKIHFYQLLEQLTAAATLPRDLSRSERMRTQRLEVERALYMYKADQLIVEAQRAHQTQ